MTRVLLLGAGKIGRMIARFLVQSGDYQVHVGDVDPRVLDRVSEGLDVSTATINATDFEQLCDAMSDRQVVISALSYAFDPLIAEAALATGASYFDLTEDVATTRKVKATATRARPGQIFMPQCGLAPGFVSIVANHLTRDYDEIDRVHMRVGALPLYPTNTLKYNLTWSTDGLINEYCNPCEAIHEGQRIDMLPLEGLEQFSLDGIRYEAFNTSGGLGTLCETLEGRVRELNYKTIRYIGHRDLVAFLVNELRMSHRREFLKDLLESAIPITLQDVVVTFCTVSGRRKGDLIQYSDARKIYHRQIGGESWSAIQITTAAGICAVVDLHVNKLLPETGFVRQEQVDFERFLENRFGSYYDATAISPGLGDARQRIRGVSPEDLDPPG